jgi:hypothetical protein
MSTEGADALQHAVFPENMGCHKYSQKPINETNQMENEERSKKSLKGRSVSKDFRSRPAHFLKRTS